MFLVSNYIQQMKMAMFKPYIVMVYPEDISCQIKIYTADLFYFVGYQFLWVAQFTNLKPQ